MFFASGNISIIEEKTGGVHKFYYYFSVLYNMQGSKEAERDIEGKEKSPILRWMIHHIL